MRHQTPADLFREVTFQFTHPGKGATTPRRCERPQRRVSIHAPWEGCDLRGSSSASLSVTFQFTHPGKGATCSRPLGTHARGGFNSRTLGRVRQSYRRQPPDGHAVSIHAPWEGCDQVAPNPLSSYQAVSIHAPWEGCDLGVACADGGIECFNSRTLGRVRLFVTGQINGWSKFQFTHPGKGATGYVRSSRSVAKVSIHAPWEGCDQAARRCQSVRCVSIHAPWEGCDLHHA